MTTRRFLSTASLAAYAFFIGTVLAMPFLKESYSPIDQTISEGAIGDFGWVQAVGFLLLATASLGVAALLYRERVERPAIAVTAAVLAFSAVFTIMLAILPTDSPGETTVTGKAHVIAAALAFLVAIGGIASAGVTFRGHRVLEAFAPWSCVAAAAAFVLLVMTGLGVDPTGVWQRATVACEVAWFVTVAVRVWTAEGDSRPLLRAGPTGAVG